MGGHSRRNLLQESPNLTGRVTITKLTVPLRSTNGELSVGSSRIHATKPDSPGLSQGVACEAASERGGIVLPTLFVGTGGGHKDYPWTIMMDGDAEIRAILQKTLQRLNEFGVKVAVLFTGHFAPEQLEMIESIASTWKQTGRSMKVLALAINMPLESALSPDHAGVFETTVLSKFFKETIDLGELPSLSDSPAIDPDGDPYGLHRHDPEHVLWGVFGPDPRKYDSAAADALVGKLTLEINAAVDSAIA
jgi:creatinine amidohydrolase